MNTPKIFVCALLVLAAICDAKISDDVETNKIDQVEKISNVTTVETHSGHLPSIHSFLPTDLGWRSGLGQALTIGGAIIASLLLLGGFSFFATPVMGFRVCQVLGNCDTATQYSASGVSPASAQPNSYGDAYGPYVPGAAYGPYHKRSVDYVGPIIKALNIAYEKFGKPHESKKE